MRKIYPFLFTVFTVLTFYNNAGGSGSCSCNSSCDGTCVCGVCESGGAFHCLHPRVCEEIDIGAHAPHLAGKPSADE